MIDKYDTVKTYARGFINSEINKFLENSNGKQLLSECNRILYENGKFQSENLTFLVNDADESSGLQTIHSKENRKIVPSSDISAIIKEKLSKILLNTISEEYSDLINGDTEAILASMMKSRSETKKRLIDFTKEEINQLLKNLNTKIFTVEVDNIRTIFDNNKSSCIIIDLRITLKPTKPEVEVISKPPLVNNPLLKILFKTEGECVISDLMIKSDNKKLEIDSGIIAANFVVSLQNVKVFGKDVRLHKDIFQNEDPLYVIYSKEVSKKLPKINFV